MPGTHEMHVSCVFFEWYMGGMNQKRTDDMGLPSFSSSQNAAAFRFHPHILPIPCSKASLVLPAETSKKSHLTVRAVCAL